MPALSLLHAPSACAGREDGHSSYHGMHKEECSAADGMQGSHSLLDMSEDILSPVRAGEVNPLVLMGLATCHAVSRFGDQLVGNQVEACTSPHMHCNLLGCQSYHAICICNSWMHCVLRTCTSTGRFQCRLFAVK